MHVFSHLRRSLERLPAALHRHRWPFGARLRPPVPLDQLLRSRPGPDVLAALSMGDLDRLR
jgi:hypothetical protein